MVEGTGILDIVSGGIVSGLITISNGGAVSVGSGGRVGDTAITNAGDLIVLFDGSVTSTTVNSGGKTFVFGTAVGTKVSGH